MKKVISISAVALVALAATGCGESSGSATDSKDLPASPTATTDGLSNCFAPGKESEEAVAGGAEGEPLKIVSSAAVRSGDFTFVALKFTEADYSGEREAVWMRGEAGATFAVDEMAKTVAEWPAASKVKPGTDITTPGAKEALACLK